jgi:hypothetical protein
VSWFSTSDFILLNLANDLAGLPSEGREDLPEFARRRPPLPLGN